MTPHRTIHIAGLLSLVTSFSLFSQTKEADVVPAPPSLEERLAELEEQALDLARKLAELRKEAASAPPKGARAAVNVAQEMVKGVIARCYVRTTDASLPPGSRMTPGDERHGEPAHFNGFEQARAAGYNAEEAVSVMYEGYLQITAPVTYEFLMDFPTGSASGTFSIGGHTLSFDGERNVRLDLKPGMHLVRVFTWNKSRFYLNNQSVIIRIKESGRDPRQLVPADLFTPASRVAELAR